MFAAAYAHTVPGMFSYVVTPLHTHFFCDEHEARVNGFHRARF
ncbi:hypothetical protein [Nonomuraea sp. NPDC049784]